METFSCMVSSEDGPRALGIGDCRDIINSNAAQTSMEQLYL